MVLLIHTRFCVETDSRHIAVVRIEFFSSQELNMSCREPEDLKILFSLHSGAFQKTCQTEVHGQGASGLHRASGPGEDRVKETLRKRVREVPREARS